MYGINANDGNAIEAAAQFAYDQGWYTPEKAIIGGAEWISNNYIGKGQNTLYEMRWNPECTGTHQYATDVECAIKQSKIIKRLYDELPKANLTFDIPSYEEEN